MKIYYAYVATALAFSIPQAVYGDAIKTCGEQSDCITFSIEEFLPGSMECGTACEWDICLTLDLTAEGCIKGADTVSHTCVKSEDSCANSPCIFSGETKNLVSGHTQCQTVGPGETATFLLKDGAGCEGSLSDTMNAPDGSVIASCAPSSAQVSGCAFQSCTGNAVGKECIWSVVAPVCSGEPPVQPVTGRCPKGKNVCYTEDCNCILGACKNKYDFPYTTVAELESAGVIVNNDGIYELTYSCGESGTEGYGKDLSNIVFLGSTCDKYEDFPVDESIQFDEYGDLLTPFTLKCGNSCYVYGGEFGNEIECN